jgi:hypothetical protein
MNQPHLEEEDMVLHYYGETDSPDRVSAHLEACAQCRKEFLALRRLLDEEIVSDVPDPGPEYGARLWRRLSPVLLEDSRPWWKKQIVFRGLLVPLAAAALFVVVFLIGRYGPTPPDPIALISEKATESLFAMNVNRHLERTQVMVQDLSNLERGVPVDLDDQRAWATELLADNRIYRNLAKGRGDAGMEAFLSQVEFLLIELANSDDETLMATLASEQETYSELLFQLRIIRSRLENNPFQPTADPDTKTI